MYCATPPELLSHPERRQEEALVRTISDNKLVRAVNSWKPLVAEGLITAFKAAGLEKGNVVEYGRNYYSSLLETGQPTTFHQEYHSELWVPNQGSVTVYTVAQIRPGPRGLENPAPPPPSDADKLLLGRDRPGFGILEPRAYGMGIAQHWGPEQNFSGRPVQVHPRGRPSPPKWIPLQPMEVLNKPEPVHGNNFQLGRPREWNGQVARPGRKSMTWHPYLTITPELSGPKTVPDTNWRKESANQDKPTWKQALENKSGVTITLVSSEEEEEEPWQTVWRRKKIWSRQSSTASTEESANDSNSSTSNSDKLGKSGEKGAIPSLQMLSMKEVPQEAPAAQAAVTVTSPQSSPVPQPKSTKREREEGSCGFHGFQRPGQSGRRSPDHDFGCVERKSGESTDNSDESSDLGRADTGDESNIDGGLEGSGDDDLMKETITRVAVRMHAYKIIFILSIIYLLQFGKTEAATPTALFTQEGNIYMAQQIIHIPIDIPMKDLHSQCHNFYSFHRVSKNIPSTPAAERWFSIIRDVEQACNGLFLMEKQFSEDSDMDTNRNRQKRGVFLKGIQILKTIFGNFDIFDLGKIRKLINKFHWKHEAETTKLSKRIDKLTEDMTQMDQRFERTELTWTWRKMRSDAAWILSQAEAVADGIRMARHGQLSTGLVNITTAAHILQVVNIHLKKERGAIQHQDREEILQPVTKTPLEIYDCPVSLINFDDGPKLLIHLPIAAEKLKLYQFSAIPFTWNNRTLKVKPEQVLLAQNEVSTMSLTSEQLDRCWQIRPKDWVCHHTMPLFTKPDSECLGAIKESKASRITERCGFEVVKETTVAQLGKSFIFYSPKETTLEFECPHEEIQRESGIIGLSQKDLMPGCKVTSDDFKLWQPQELLLPSSFISSVEWNGIIIPGFEDNINQTQENARLEKMEWQLRDAQNNLTAINVSLPTSVTIILIIMVVLTLISSISLRRETTTRTTGTHATRPRSTDTTPRASIIRENTVPPLNNDTRPANPHLPTRLLAKAVRSKTDSMYHPLTLRPRDKRMPSPENIYDIPGPRGSPVRMPF